jgi:hypothetical protein
VSRPASCRHRRGRDALGPAARRLRSADREAHGASVRRPREWRTFRTFRAAPSGGRWSHTYRFDGTRGTLTYRFRVRIPIENGVSSRLVGEPSPAEASPACSVAGLQPGPQDRHANDMLRNLRSPVASSNRPLGRGVTRLSAVALHPQLDRSARLPWVDRCGAGPMIGRAAPSSSGARFRQAATRRTGRSCR